MKPPGVNMKAVVNKPAHVLEAVIFRVGVEGRDEDSKCRNNELY